MECAVAAHGESRVAALPGRERARKGGQPGKVRDTKLWSRRIAVLRPLLLYWHVVEAGTGSVCSTCGE